MAAILGGALSLSGFLLQTFFENPIAGPFVLGISSGAKMVVALTMIFYLEWARNITSYTMIVAAFLGSLLSVGFILLMSRRIKNMAGLLVGGIMIGYICSAVTDFVVTFAEDSDIVNLHGWSQGSFSGMSWSNVAISAAVIGITFVITFLMAKPIGAYQLGEAYAQSMGVNIKVFRIALILLSSILSACVTAFAGPISFVGIAVPFLVKQSLGTSRLADYTNQRTVMIRPYDQPLQCFTDIRFIIRCHHFPHMHPPSLPAKSPTPVCPDLSFL